APFILIKAILADHGIHFLPANLENPMVFAGAYGLVSVILMYALSCHRSRVALPLAGIGIILTLWVSAVSPSAIALILLLTVLVLLSPLLIKRKHPDHNLWDHSMLHTGQPPGWYSNLWLWWAVLGTILVGIYWKFW